MMEKTFSIELNPAELAWLAGAFGQTRLLLPDAPLQRLLDDELSAILAEAQASLVARGLIRHTPGSGWQIEQAVAVVIQLLSGPEWTLSLLRLSRAGGEVRGMVYRAARMHLLLEMPPAYRLTFCKDEKILLDRLMADLGSRSDPKVGKATGRGAMTLAHADRLFPHAWREEASFAGVDQVVLLTAALAGAGIPSRRGLLLQGLELLGGEVDVRGEVRMTSLGVSALKKFLQSFLSE
ncbi:MAG: hypothetical protein JXB85_05175 [Anaerolineales bacterium]|nr:hypothetical protein [Anaerolineales bacterium]